jgi:hypothetical protein
MNLFLIATTTTERNVGSTESDFDRLHITSNLSKSLPDSPPRLIAKKTTRKQTCLFNLLILQISNRKEETKGGEGRGERKSDF